MPAAIAILGTLEATRRHCGLVLAVLAGCFMAYGFFGWLAPGIFEAAYLSPARYLLYIYNDTNGVPGLVLSVGATQILGFIVFGAVLNAVGSSAALTDLALATMGHRRGGPAKVAILASSLFGTLSGSTVANVMSTGVVTIPMMKKAGFPARYAAAIEAVASNGGQIAPPVMGATAFVIAEFLQVAYSDVVIAALLPAVFYYLLLYRQVDRYAAAHGLVGERPGDVADARPQPAGQLAADRAARRPDLVPVLSRLLARQGGALFGRRGLSAALVIRAPRDVLRVIPRILLEQRRRP